MKLALAGDAMLGRKVAEHLADGAATTHLLSDEVVSVTRHMTMKDRIHDVQVPHAYHPSSQQAHLL